MSNEDIETVEAFRMRSRVWIQANLGPLRRQDLVASGETDEDDLADIARNRDLQRTLFDAGFAGIAIPREYGGLGLTPAHQRAFNEELSGKEYPSRLAVPTFSPCLAVLLDFGTEEQKGRHVPAILRGEEIWCQLLSEPSGGSDVAGALTRAVPDGDDWILNGTKVWTSDGWFADWGLCLARTDWDVPKHAGLTVFIVPLQQQGIEIHRIERLNGAREFCEEFLTDVRVPDSDRIGGINDGWTVGSRWMYHERVSSNSPYVTMPAGLTVGKDRGVSAVSVARDAGRIENPDNHDLCLIGEARGLELVGDALDSRLAKGAEIGVMGEHSAAVGRLFKGMAYVRRISIAFELTGGTGVAWDEDDGEAGGIGMDFLLRQMVCIGGGTTEIARNIISERLLGMPRERADDRNVPFREVPRGPRQ